MPIKTPNFIKTPNLKKWICADDIQLKPQKSDEILIIQDTPAVTSAKRIFQNHNNNDLCNIFNHSIPS